ncbi:MAG TPA: glucoamylase family protein [Gemmataceae bacterium]|nr:glucoamylase family protein [Gemmataceae bacterium]
MSEIKLDNERLDALQEVTHQYYIHEININNGLVADKTEPGTPASIAATGMALATVPIHVERDPAQREMWAEHIRARLRFFWQSPQGTEPDATGYKGFYYHFLDMQTGRRAWDCELSTVDSAFLLAGILTAGWYFDRDSEVEREIRTLAEALYRRADWRWAQNGRATVTHGWKPETGFLPYRYEGYDEALLLYVLGLGSPTYSLPEESYAAWASSYEWKSVYGYEYLYSGPLFTHQLSHLWLDLRGIQDAFMRDHGIDYFENTRRATYVHQQYAIRNPLQFEGYNDRCWGITASNGPGWVTRRIKGVQRQFFDYVARGAPYGPDDGTIAPWVVVASLPFAPEIVAPTIEQFSQMDLGMLEPYGFKSTFNLTFEAGGNCRCWVSPWHFGIDQGPIILMIENYRTGLLWNVMRRCPYIVSGLRRAGFRGGWL